MIQPTAQQMYPQQGGANAVAINIYNPQAYGAPQQQAPQMPNYTNSFYQMPTASMYQPQMDPMAAYYQQFMPMQNPIQPMMMPQYQPELMAAPMPQVMPQPAPQIMPESIMEQPQVQATPEVQPQPEVAAAPEAAPQVEAQPEVAAAPEAEAAPAAVVDTEGLVNALKGSDAAQKEEAINKIAEHVQDSADVALQVVSEPIMQALVDVINEDTTALQGPTDAQIAVAEKVAKGEQLTPEEDALAEQLSPRDQANKNRIFALYTIAMIQKLQKEELAQYSENQVANGGQALEPLKVQDLIGYNDIVNVIKNDSRPEVKVAAIQALRYVADKNDAQAIKEVLTESLNSTDEAVKAAAQEAMTIVDAAA